MPRRVIRVNRVSGLQCGKGLIRFIAGSAPEAIEDTGRELSAISGSANPGPVIAEKLLMWVKKVQERVLQADKPVIQSNKSLGKYDADK
jgi:hypothetical protein